MSAESTPLKELADVIRSKNAGIHAITIDVMFTDERRYTAVKDTGVLSAALFADLYNLDESEVQFYEYDAGNSFKVTIPRETPAGNFGERDVFGAQQHAPVRDVKVPVASDELEG